MAESAAARRGPWHRDHLTSAGRFILFYAKTRRGDFVALLVLVVLAAVCAVVMQYQMKRLVDAMAASLTRPVWTALTVFVVLMAAESVLLRLSAWLTCRATIGAGVQMRLDLFEYLAGHSMRYFADNLAGSLGQRITGTAGNFGALANTAAWRIVPPVVDYIGALVIFSSIDWPMAAVLGACVGGATGILLLAGHRGRPLHSAYAKLASAVAGNLIDVISNMWAVKAFTARQREAERLREQFRGEAQAQHASWMYTEKTRIFYDLSVWTIASAMSFWAVYIWSRHRITAGDVVIITALTFRILHGSRDVALALVDTSLQVGYIEDTLQAIGQIHGLADAPSVCRRMPGPGRITLRNVSFGYDAHRPVLRQINLVVNPGEKVGIVGASGAGKSTIVQLIQRLHVPQAGEIAIDGRPIEEYAQDALRAALAVVPQEITLFHRTIRENIRFGRSDATDEEVYAAAAAAQCADFIRSLPQGYETLVGERGVKLSGGQRQRIGIARAFLKTAPILILDEATSALDTDSELRIQASIMQRRRCCTVIAVAHRLSTLAAYDRILVIDRGCIVEQGAPSDLRRRGDIFRSMWRLQSEGLSVDLTERVAGETYE